jgi:hypothetical protein
MHRLIALGLLVGTSLGCDASETATSGSGGTSSTSTTGGAGGEEPSAVTEAIAMCYETLHGDVAKREASLAALKAAAEEHPDNARVHLFFGMCSLAALAEDQNLAALGDIDRELARAAELAPDDRRIPGWLASVRVQVAVQLGDDEGLAVAVDEMIAAADLYPEFNNVSLAIAFSGLPLTTPYPEMARARLEAIEDCGETDEKCRDNEAAPHNIPGSLMLFGDVYARVGDLANARKFYTGALAATSASSWPYRAEAEAILANVDARVMTWSDADDANDPEFFLSSARTCVGCHQ